jgi:predicted glycosyltransferase
MPEDFLILFQVPNHVGLGHMNRMACVALALRELAPKVRSLFVVEGAPHGLLESLNLPYLTLPVPELVYHSNAWVAWPKDNKMHFVKAIASSILEAGAPDLVVYDCFPSIHFIDAVIAAGIRSVLCIRKVKDFEAYASDARVHPVLESSTSILVPHSESEFNLPKRLSPRIEYVGPIVKQLPIDPEPAQIRFNLPGKRIIVISGGGGGHHSTVHFLNLCLRAFTLIKPYVSDTIALLITGPLFAEWSCLELTTDVRVIPFDPQFIHTCATADLVLAQAGYNSANELAALGTPTICIPAERGFDDQFERARALAKNNSHIDCFEGGESEKLAALMLERLGQSVERSRSEVSDGAYRAAVHLIDLLRRG